MKKTLTGVVLISALLVLVYLFVFRFSSGKEKEPNPPVVSVIHKDLDTAHPEHHLLDHDSISLYNAREELNLVTIQEIYKSLDVTHPGRGLPDYDSDQQVDIPKSYAMVLIAELIRKEKSILEDIPSMHVIAGNWLLNNSRLSPDAQLGWGVPIAWDAYGDGSVNPENTIYTISNAIVMRALLDWIEKSPSDAPDEQIHQQLKAMALPYLDVEMRTPSGLLPYSLMGSDRVYDTFNPAAYFAGQLQRYSRMVDEQYGKKLSGLADQTMKSLLSHRQTDARGRWYWHYSVQEATPNDLPHASYIVLGIRDYLQYGGLLAPQFSWASVIDHLASFSRNGPTLFAWPDFSRDIDIPARLYDVGMALYVLCNEPKLQGTRNDLLRSIPRYRDAAGNYVKYPMGSGQDERKGSRVINEYVSYLYVGLLSCIDTGTYENQSN